MLLDLLPRWLAVVVVLSGVAHAERLTTRDALDRLEEILEMRQEDGLLDPVEVVPTLLVSAAPIFQESQGSYPARALAMLTRRFGNSGVRACEACMRVRTTVEDGRLEQTSGPVSLEEVARLDERFRGDSTRARTAIWLDETASGVAVRVVDISSGRVVFAQNVDPELFEYQGSARSFRLSAELERRTRGESLTHAIFDLALYPGQHVSFEWDDQWGETNANLSGVVLSFFDPVFGVGASYGRDTEFWDICIGVQGILSIPTVVAEAHTGEDADLIDPTFTGALLVRIPFGSSNFAGLLSASTNGRFGIGLSLLNTSFIPLLP